MIGKQKYKGNGEQHASFEVLDGGRARVSGSLHFATVSALFTAGVAAIKGGRADVIDLAGVTASDSAGLALLIEWLSVAKSAGRTLRFENIPSQLQQLARLSEVEELLVPGLAQAATGATAEGRQPPSGQSKVNRPTNPTL